MSDPSHSQQPYGPRTPAVRRFLERLANLTPDEWAAGARGYATAWHTPAGARADGALADAIARTGREGARDQLVGPVVQMARNAAKGAPPAAGRRAGPQHEALAEEALAEAALAAALAVLARDALSADDYALLTGPFAAAASASPD